MSDALKELAEVGADQTMQSASDHNQYMKGNSKALLVSVKQAVSQALSAASAMVSKTQAQSLTTFIQAPFTGSYAAQSGDIVGILKDMRDTFKANLAEATRKWEISQKEHGKYMKQMQDEFKTMESSYNAKQGSLGTNDNSLATFRSQLEAAQLTQTEAEDFLTSLLQKCNVKAKQYEQRVDLRVNEQAAISQAVQILNSDESFATLKEATSFIQERSVKRRRSIPATQKRQEAVATPQTPKAFLQQEAAKAGGSTILGKIAAMIKSNSPFDSVLQDIVKMKQTIEDEGKADKEQKEWCEKERSETNKQISDKKNDISELNTDISSLKADIQDPVTGLMVQIKNEEDALSECLADQAEETKERTAENAEYQKEIANLVASQDLVSRAVRVLKKYYDKIAKESETSLLQAEATSHAVKRNAVKEEPNTWEDKYKGQSSDGSKATGTLEVILENIQKSEKAAHDAEVTAQQSFEDSMEKLKQTEKDTQDSLANLRVSLAEKEKTLRQKNRDLVATTREKEAAETYLVDIKPGCDFIMKNIATRNFNRAEEKKALTKAVGLIKETPAYENAMLDKHIP